MSSKADERKIFLRYESDENDFESYTCDIPEARRIYEKQNFIKEEYIMKKKILA